MTRLDDLQRSWDSVSLCRNGKPRVDEAGSTGTRLLLWEQSDRKLIYTHKPLAVGNKYAHKYEDKNN